MSRAGVRGAPSPSDADGGRASPLPVEVRPLDTHAQRDDCVELQRRIWGAGYTDVVPASVLKISQEVGGVAAGAFVEGDGLVGFVYGITGVRDGRLSHWSHMLGVLDPYRGHGIGQRLKHFQRDWLRERGVLEMRWTFDPLVSGNAHFNLNRLGVDAVAYIPDMYGDTGSGLHSFGTDRLLAHWHLGDDDRSRDGKRSDEDAAWDDAPVLNGGDGDRVETLATPGDAPPTGIADNAPERIRIWIPRDILAVNREDPDGARAWRRSTRAAFQAAWEGGYRIVGFRRARNGGGCHYLLEAREEAGGGTPA